MLVSLLMPTRGRPQLALRSLRSLAEHTAKPARIEIMLAVDEDDLASWDQMRAGLVDLPFPYQCVAYEPLGYGRLHEYNNSLAAKAQGKWLFIWNDDCLMETPRWDDFVAEVGDDFGLLDPIISNAHEQFQRGLFPLVPKRWFSIVGHISLSCQTDTYLTLVANALGCRYAAPFSIYHDRYDETGHNNDATYQARTYQTDEFYQSDAMCLSMNHDVALIAKALGRPITHLIRRWEPSHVD